MVGLIFCTIVPCVLGVFLVLFTVFSLQYTIMGRETIPFICRLTDWLDSAGSDSVLPLVVLILMILIAIYCVYAGLVYLGNFKFLIGEPEDTTITYDIVELYKDKLKVTVSESSSFSVAQLLMGLWNYILLPILAFVFITAFGWLVFIVQLIRYLRGTIVL